MYGQGGRGGGGKGLHRLEPGWGVGVRPHSKKKRPSTRKGRLSTRSEKKKKGSGTVLRAQGEKEKESGIVLREREFPRAIDHASVRGMLLCRVPMGGGSSILKSI